MSDTDQSPRQTESEAHQHHAYDNPRLSGKEFLLAVMHDPTVDIRDRIKAASTLLRVYGEHEFELPRIKYIIGGISPCVARAVGLEPWSPPDSTGIHSQNSFGAQIPVTHNLEAGDPVNIEKRIEALSFDQIIH